MNTPRNIYELTELFIAGQYLKQTGISPEFAHAALSLTAAYSPSPYEPTCDMVVFHQLMMSYLNL
jgi:hypothetical protein